MTTPPSLNMLLTDEQLYPYSATMEFAMTHGDLNYSQIDALIKMIDREKRFIIKQKRGRSFDLNYMIKFFKKNL